MEEGWQSGGCQAGQSFHTAPASWLLHISGGGVDEIRVAEVPNFSILWAGTKEQPFKVHRSW